MKNKKLIIGALALVLVVCLCSVVSITNDESYIDNDSEFTLGASSSATVGQRWSYNSSFVSEWESVCNNSDGGLRFGVQMPSWVTKSGSTFSGIPSSSGTYKIILDVYNVGDNKTDAYEEIVITVSSGSSGGSTTYYTITYDKNGATRWDLSYTSQRLVSGSTVALPSSEIGKLGSTLIGWKIGSTTYAPGETYTIRSNVTAVAQWTASELELTYFANGGISESGSIVKEKVLSGVPVNLISSGYSKPGYIWTGWNTKADGTGIHYDPGQSVAFSYYTNLYAEYVKPILTLNCDEIITQLESSSGVLFLTDNSTEVSSGSTVYLPQLEPRLSDGWVQVVTGWRDANGNTLGMECVIEESLVLSPVISNYFHLILSDPAVTVEFDQYWSSYFSHIVDWGNGQTVTVDSITSPNLSYQYPANSYYTITVQSSYLDNTVHGSYGVEIFGADSDIVLHTVTFETSGGSNVASQKIPDGSKVTVPIDPKKSGYRFDGWYSDVLYTDLFDFETVIKSDITVYAKWIDQSLFSINFETNGGSEIDTRYVEKDTKISKPDDPLKEGYKFAGWYVNKDCTVAFDFDTPISENFTLYAKWTADGSSGSSSIWSWLLVIIVVICSLYYFLGRDSK